MTAKLQTDNSGGEDRKGPTPLHSIRISDADWALFVIEADKRGFGSTSEFIRATMLKEIRTKR